MSYSAPLANGTAKQSVIKLTDTEKARFTALIQRTHSLTEVAKLEKEMSEGRLPAGIADADVMDET